MSTSHGNAAPLLSVVIPAYNGADVVAAAIESVLHRLDDEAEVIVVDDGSTDATGDVVRRYRDRVRCITQVNGGLAAARNRGHSEARGAFVAWFDQDDINEPERFPLQLEVLRRYPEIGLVSTGFSAFNENGTIADSFAARYYGKIARSGVAALFPVTETFESEVIPSVTFPLHRGMVYPALALGNFVHPPTVMMRSAVWHAAGPLKAGLASGTDWEFLVRASRQHEFAYIDQSLLRYRRSREQMTDESNTRANLPGEMRAFGLILEADPSLRNATEEVRGLYRHWNVSLATALAPTDRVEAFRYLARSLRYGSDFRSFLRAAVRITAPAFLVPALRWARRRVSAAR